MVSTTVIEGAECAKCQRYGNRKRRKPDFRSHINYAEEWARVEKRYCGYL